jgi:hypothetical protein
MKSPLQKARGHRRFSVPSRRAPVAHTDTRVRRQPRDPLRATLFRHWKMAKKRMHRLGTLLASLIHVTLPVNAGHTVIGGSGALLADTADPSLRADTGFAAAVGGSRW